MSGSPSSYANVEAGRDRRRVRDRLLPLLSVVVAVLLALGTWQVAARVREYNSNRAVGGLIVAGMMSGKAASRPNSTEPEGTELTEPGEAQDANDSVNPRTGLPWLALPHMPMSSSAEDGAPVPALPMGELSRATSYAEVVVYVWERILYGVAGVVGLAGLIGLVTRWVRGPHLVAAALLLLSTIATLVGMRLLVDPAAGAFHPLPLQSYLIAGLAQSAYGLILLAAFSRKPR